MYLKFLEKTFAFFLIICILIISNTAYAQESDFEKSIFFNGEINFDIASQYSAGDTLSTGITISNMETFPIMQAYLTVEIVEGCKEPTYPSQTSDCDNVFYEKTFENIDIAAESNKNIQFEYILPGNLKDGDYRIDIYLRTKKSPIIGMTHIFLPGKHKSFSITGAGQFPEAKILRTRTYLGSEEYIGPVGAPVEPESSISGKVYIEKKPGLSSEYTLDITVCQWDDITCETPENEKSIRADLSGDNSIRILDISIKAPEKPDAYAVRLELKDKDGNTVSLYRSRLIVLGKTAKIRKIAIDKPYYKSGDNGHIDVLVFGSPDHYTKPVVHNAELTVSLKNLDTGKKIFEDSAIAPELSDNLFYRRFSFSADEELKQFEVCAKIESKDNEPYDNYCFTVYSENFISGKHEITFEEKYNINAQKIIETICVFDISGLSANTRAEILFMPQDMSSILDKRTVEIDGCTTLYYNADIEKTYSLILTDFQEKKQHRHTIVVPELDIVEEDITSQEKDSTDDTNIENEAENKINTGKIMIILLILILITTSYVYYMKKRKNKKKSYM